MIVIIPTWRPVRPSIHLIDTKPTTGSGPPVLVLYRIVSCRVYQCRSCLGREMVTGDDNGSDGDGDGDGDGDDDSVFFMLLVCARESM